LKRHDGRETKDNVKSESERKQFTVWAAQRDTGTLALPSLDRTGVRHGVNNKVVASKLDVSQVVSKWRSHFVHLRLDGMRNSKGLAPPQSIDDAV
jgi:hypothetical protein